MVVVTDASEGIKTLVFMEDSNTISQKSDSDELSFICQRSKPETGKIENRAIFGVFFIAICQFIYIYIYTGCKNDEIEATNKTLCFR